VAFCALCAGEPLLAQTADPAWLRYAPVPAQAAREHYANLPEVVVALGHSEVIAAAQAEFVRGVRGMLNRTLRSQSSLPKENAIVLGTLEAIRSAFPEITSLPKLDEDGFWLKTIDVDGTSRLLVAARNERGVLYGALYLLRKIALAEPIATLNEKQGPQVRLRMLVHADHFDGSVEHGAAGRSIFWEADRATRDLARLTDYARLLASVGINSVCINRLPANSRALSGKFLHEAARIADALRPWGVRVYIAADLASPQIIGGTRTSDPLEPDVAAFWQRKIDEAYQSIPDLGGLLVAGEFDGRLVPALYGRSHVDAADVIAAPLAAHGGVLWYCLSPSAQPMQTAADPNSDVAESTDVSSLDGHFADNVIVLSGLGCSDEQIREPPSPLFGNLENTNQAIAFRLVAGRSELSRHLHFAAPSWKEDLDFDARGKKGGLSIKQILVDEDRTQGGFVAVAGIGRDSHWLGHPLAMANLYAFGRLAWNADLPSKKVADEWARQTMGHDPLVVGTGVDLLMRSRKVYENYAAPLGSRIPLAESDIDDDDPDAAPFADDSSIGSDRTAATGDGLIAQYPSAVASRFETLDSCPEQYLLYFHRVPYERLLKSGKTIIQHLYDAHYLGARDAARAAEKWRQLAGQIDQPFFHDVLERLDYQAGHAQVLRDAACNWLLKMSDIADAQGRVGNHPHRIEAEAMQCSGYQPVDVSPSQSASGGKVISCVAPEGRGTASWKFSNKSGWYDASLFYFDENDGASRFRLFVGEQLVDEWSADDVLPDDKPGVLTATRHKIRRLALRPGDELRIEATAGPLERAVIDYVEVEPAKE
jgi:alpha-glucuronidase